MSWRVLQYAPFFGPEEYESLRDCFDATWLTEGPKSAAFLEQLRSLIGCKHACFAPNGTLALYLALRAAGIGPADEVVVPDFTFFGSASAVEMTGATPVFCDIDRDTLQVESRHIEPCITERTRAIMPVHMYGSTCDMDPIVELARRRSLIIVEDAAQALAVRYRGRHAGTHGALGCFSFFADKTITTGEGGLIVTDDDELYESLLYKRNQGRIDRGSFVHPQVGYNFRITDLQAAVGLVQLSRLDEIIARKLAILARYRALLGGMSQLRFVELAPGSTHIPFRVAIFADRAHELMSFLGEAGVQVRTFFYPLHRQPAFAHLRAPSAPLASFPGATYAYEHGVCLPSYPGLPVGDLEYVCDRIRAFYA